MITVINRVHAWRRDDGGVAFVFLLFQLSARAPERVNNKLSYGQFRADDDNEGQQNNTIDDKLAAYSGVCDDYGLTIGRPNVVIIGSFNRSNDVDRAIRIRHGRGKGKRGVGTIAWKNERERIIRKTRG